MISGCSKKSSWFYIFKILLRGCFCGFRNNVLYISYMLGQKPEALHLFLFTLLLLYLTHILKNLRQLTKLILYMLFNQELEIKAMKRMKKECWLYWMFWLHAWTVHWSQCFLIVQSKQRNMISYLVILIFLSKHITFRVQEKFSWSKLKVNLLNRMNKRKVEQRRQCCHAQWAEACSVETLHSQWLPVSSWQYIWLSGNSSEKT